jgi:hypothetical protein
LKSGQELSSDVDSSSSQSTRLPHRALQAFANQQLASSSASNSDGLRFGPVRVPVAQTPYVTFSLIHIQHENASIVKHFEHIRRASQDGWT